MTEQIENILAELKAIQAKLPELRDLFWLKIDRYNEADQQRGVAFDDKFEQQRDKLFRVIDSFSAFIEKSFAPTSEEVAREQALQKLRVEFPGFDDWNEEAKKALLDREIATKLLIMTKIQNTKIDKVTKFDDFNKKTPPRNLIVTFHDGTEISNKYATISLIETIKKIGINKISELNLPYISTNRDILRTATEIENGYFIETNTSTRDKKRQLDEISNRLDLNLKIEISER
jgi:hypothetical protein